MRLALLIPTLEGGGAERVIVNLANEFASRGHSVDIVLREKKGVLLKEVSSDVRVVDLGKERLVAILPGLVSYLRTQRPDALLSALDNPNVVSTLAVKFARSGTRLVLSQHNTLTAGWLHGGRRRDILSRFIGPVYPLADRVVAVSHGVASDLAARTRLRESEVSVIYNPIVSEAFGARRGEPSGHPWLDDESVPVVMAAGRLTKQKDHKTLILAFLKVLALRDVRLIVLGEGEERQRLEQLIDAHGLGDFVRLPGYVTNPHAWMARAKLFVLSSLWEGFGNVLVEAMALGIPVISTDCPSGPSEILQDGKWGQLVPAGNADALAAGINFALGQSVGPDVVSRALDFSIERSADQYLEVLGGGKA